MSDTGYTKREKADLIAEANYISDNYKSDTPWTDKNIEEIFAEGLSIDIIEPDFSRWLESSRRYNIRKRWAMRNWYRKQFLDNSAENSYQDYLDYLKGLKKERDDLKIKLATFKNDSKGFEAWDK